MSNHGAGGGAGQPLLVLFNVVVVAMAFSFASLGGIDWCGGSKVAAGAGAGAEGARKQKGAGKAQGEEKGSKKGRGAK